MFVYATFCVSPTSGEELIKIYSHQTQAVHDVIKVLKTPYTQRPALDNSNNIIFTTQRHNGQILDMYIIREYKIDDLPNVETNNTNSNDLPNNEIIPNNSDYSQTTALNQSTYMYKSYLNLRHKIINNIKQNKKIANIISQTPGAGPNPTTKPGHVYIDKPQDLTPSRIEAICNYLHKHNIDLNNI